MGKPFNQGYVRKSDAAENVPVGAHIVIVHEEFTTVSLVIKLVCEITHHSFNVVTLVYEMAGEFFLAVPFSAICVLEVR